MPSFENRNELDLGGGKRLWLNGANFKKFIKPNTWVKWAYEIDFTQFITSINNTLSFNNVTRVLTSSVNGQGATAIIPESNDWKVTGNAGTVQTTNFIGTTDNIGLSFRTNNVIRQTITNTGDVGIGTTTPLTKLDVLGGSFIGLQKGATDGQLSITPNITNISTPSKLVTNVITAPETALRLFRAGTSAVKFNPSADLQIGTYATGLTASTNLTFRLGNGGVNTPDVDVMTMQGNGNVGIGTTTPNAPLQLANTIVNRKIVLFQAINNDHQYYGFGINNPLIRYQVDNTSARHGFFAATSATTSNELMSILGTGNVGIGTTTPTAKLEVAGTIKATAIVNYASTTAAIADASLLAGTFYTVTVGGAKQLYVK